MDFPAAAKSRICFIKEAALLDEWRLEEWLELLTDDAIYQIPPTDVPEGDARNTLFIVADDAVRIRSRVKQLLGKFGLGGKSAFAHAANDFECARAGRRGREHSGDARILPCTACATSRSIPTSVTTTSS